MHLRAKDVCRELQITLAKLDSLRARGLPTVLKDKRGYVYDSDAVAVWLLESGIGQIKNEPDPEIAPTPVETGPVFTKIRECAAYFNVNERAVKTWLTNPTFPGRPGQQGMNAQGYFPAIPIGRWLMANGKKATVPPELGIKPPEPAPSQPTTRDRLTQVKTEQALIELKRMQGKMLDAEEVAAFYRRTNAYAATAFREFLSKLHAELPATLEDDTRTAIHNAAQAAVIKAMEMLAELIEGDKDKALERYDDNTGK